jgi:hypothetical protein
MAHSLTYDPANGSTVLIGGVIDDGETLLGDTWHYQNGWIEANPTTPIPPSAYHQVVYNTMSQTIVLVSNEKVWIYE